MRSVATALVFIFAFVADTKASERAWYGFHIKAQTSGFVFNPVVDSVVIDMIAPNSPASAQGIRVGDAIIEGDGMHVPGTRALQLLRILNKPPGETLRLNFRRPSGETYAVTIVGIQKPTH